MTYLNLYNSFHWQGSTVSTLDHALEAHKMGVLFHFAVLLDDFFCPPGENWEEFRTEAYKISPNGC